MSARIEDEAERQRLRDASRADRRSRMRRGGYIVRTAAEGATARRAAAPTCCSCRSSGRRSARRRGARRPASSCTRTCRCRCACCATRRAPASSACASIPSATFAAHARVRRSTSCRISRRASSCTPSDRPIFDLYGIEDEIQNALERKVPLKSGGYLIFDQTEAMTTIDVNTGAYVGHRNLEETIFRTNLEAAVAIARQLRLRNLGGIIIIDFIDMEEEEHRRQVLQALDGTRSPSDHAKIARHERVAARPRRDDPQAHARKPGTRALPGLSNLRRPRLREDAGNRLLRDLPRDPASARASSSSRSCSCSRTRT